MHEKNYKNVFGKYLIWLCDRSLAGGGGGVPLYVVLPCLPSTACHSQVQNNFVIRSKNGEAIIQCG